MYPSTSKNTIVSIRTGKPLNFPSIVLENPVEYPAEWFEKDSHKGKKPSVKVFLSKDSSLETSRSWAYGVVNGDKVAIGSAVEYLFHVMATMKETLEEDWVSFNRTISKGEITPLSLIEVEKIDIERSILYSPSVALSDSDDPGLVLHLAGLYRIAKSHPKQEHQIIARIDPILKTLVSSNYLARLSRSRINCKPLAELPEVEFLFSALDMFLVKFPHNKFSKCRLGTLILRDLGFSALDDIDCLKKYLGVDSDLEAFSWFLVSDAGEELMQINKKREEFNLEHSYIHYAMGFRLSQKSPYSAATNPAIHFIVHVLGSLMHKERSLHAIAPKSSFFTKRCATNAAIIYIEALKHVHDKKSHEAYKDTFNNKEEAKPAALLVDLASTGEINKPVLACKKYKNSGGKFSTLDFNKLVAAVEGIRNPRVGTIGKWVKDTFLTMIEKEE